MRTPQSFFGAISTTKIGTLYNNNTSNIKLNFNNLHMQVFKNKILRIISMNNKNYNIAQMKKTLISYPVVSLPISKGTETLNIYIREKEKKIFI